MNTYFGDFREENIINAIRVFASTSSNKTEINRANAFLYKWFQTDECVFTSYNLFISSDLPLPIRHIVLTTLHRKVISGWSYYDANFKQVLKNYFIKTLYIDCQIPPSFLKTVLQIIAVIAVYEYPEIWGDFLDNLITHQNNPYTIQLISMYASLLEECDFITKARLLLLRKILNSYIPFLIQLISTATGENLSYSLSILNSILIWGDACDLGVNIAHIIISGLPSQESYDCLKNLLHKRAQYGDLIEYIVPYLIQSLTSDPNIEFTLLFLRKYGQTIENDSLLVHQFFLILLTTEIDAADLDDYWDYWYHICLKIVSPAFVLRSSPDLIATYQSLFELMRRKFLSLLPLAIGNGKVVDFTALNTFNLMVKIDIQGYLNLVSKVTEEQGPSIGVTCSFGVFNFFASASADQKLYEFMVNYLISLFQNTSTTQSDFTYAMFAWSRSICILKSNQIFLEKFCEIIICCLNSDRLDLQETAANCFSYSVSKDSILFVTKMREFCLIFLAKFSELIKLEDFDEKILVTMTKSVSYILKAMFDNDTSLYDQIAADVISIINFNAPTALKIIRELGYNSENYTVFAFSKIWSPLFALAKMNDPLLSEYVVDALCAGFIQVDFDEYKNQIDLFIQFLTNMERNELAFSAIAICRAANSRYEEYYPFFESLVTNEPSKELFMMYSEFSPHLIKMDQAIPLLCEGIIKIDTEICNSALRCVKSFVKILDSVRCKPFIEKYRKFILFAIFCSLTDFVHCTLTSELSHTLIDYIVFSEIMEVGNIEQEIFGILKTVCEEPTNGAFSDFIVKLLQARHEKSAAKSVIIDFLITLKYATSGQQIEILNEIDDFENQEQQIIDEISTDTDIPIEEFQNLTIRKRER